MSAAERSRRAWLRRVVLAERDDLGVRLDCLAGLSPAAYVDDLVFADDPLHCACWTLRGRDVTPRRRVDGDGTVTDGVPVEAVDLEHLLPVRDGALDTDLSVEGVALLVDPDYPGALRAEANRLSHADRRVAWQVDRLAIDAVAVEEVAVDRSDATLALGAFELRLRVGQAMPSFLVTSRGSADAGMTMRCTSAVCERSLHETLTSYFCRSTPLPYVTLLTRSRVTRIVHGLATAASEGAPSSAPATTHATAGAPATLTQRMLRTATPNSLNDTK